VEAVEKFAVVGRERLAERVYRGGHDLVPHPIERSSISDVADHVALGEEILDQGTTDVLTVWTEIESIHQRHEYRPTLPLNVPGQTPDQVLAGHIAIFRRIAGLLLRCNRRHMGRG